MTIERFIYIGIAIISISSIIYIPKNQIHRALVSFLAFQATTWFTSIILVQRGKLKFPVRELVKATNVNFTPQFLFYPTVFMWFILLFPKSRSLIIKSAHYIFFVSIMVWFIYFTAKYTNIGSFSNPNDYLVIIDTYKRNFFQYIICHLYVIWFFKKAELHRGE
jgi:hypothetical protein